LILFGGIAAVAVMAPRTPTFEIVAPIVSVIRMNLPPYCPSPSNTTCCAGLNCVFDMPQYLSTTILFKVSVKIGNANIGGPITWTQILVEIQKNGFTIARQANNNGMQPPQNSTPIAFEVPFDPTVSGTGYIQAMICDLTKSATGTPQFTTLGVKVTFKDCKYIASPIAVPDLSQTLSVDFTTQCVQNADDCQIASTYLSKICP
jgi:hypothetical protein